MSTEPKIKTEQAEKELTPAEKAKAAKIAEYEKMTIEELIALQEPLDEALEKE